MINKYEILFIKQLKRYIRKKYLDFLIKFGKESYKFYKHALDTSKKLFLYKENNVIKGIIGFSHNISLEKSKDRASYCILHIRCIYYDNKILFEKMLNDIENYANKNNFPRIIFNHMNTDEDTIVRLGYDNIYCACICLCSGLCIKCDEKDIFSQSYYKDLIECKDNYRLYFHK
jgi:hypothetical protein